MSCFFNRSRFARPRRLRRRPSHCPVAALESLEERVLLSSVGLSNGNLILNGSNANDVMVVDHVREGARVRARIFTGGRLTHTAQFLTSRVEAVHLRGFGGDDRMVNQTRIFDFLTGGAGNDWMTGGQLRSVMLGQGDDDRIIGRSGRNRLHGGVGDDVIVGGAQDEQLFGVAGNDTLQGNLGDDAIDGGDGSDKLLERGDVNFYLSDATLSGLGFDTLAGLERATLFGGAGDNDIRAFYFSGQVFLFGLAGDDALFGSIDGSGRLSGGAGDDSLNSGYGDDVLLGGPGNDVLEAEGNDTINGGAGIDKVISSGDFDFILTNTNLAGNGISSLQSIETATLSIFISSGRVIDASGFSGSVRMFGGAGNDHLIGGGGDDTILGREGNDTLEGGDGDDVLLGYDGDDTLSGDLGTDWLIGGAGTDTLNDSGPGIYSS